MGSGVANCVQKLSVGAMNSSYDWTPHCWVCDDRGDVYFTSNISPPCSTPPTSIPSTSTHLPGNTAQWILVGDGFDGIAAGYCGLICGIKDRSLYLRIGVTCMQPMGTEWAPQICDIVQVLVGRKCIIRKSAHGVWYYTIINAHSLVNGVLDWEVVESFTDHQQSNSNSEDVLLCHYTVDAHDRLFGLTESGLVACYNLLDEEPCWNIVAQPPPYLRSSSRARQLVSWISSMWQPQNDSSTSNGGRSHFISRISAGMSSIWCLMEDQGEVWQLVISELKKTTKWNWVKSVLPLDKDEEVLSFEACKSSVDKLFLVLREKGICKMLSYSLNSEDGGRTEVVYPSTSSCRSLAITCTCKIKPKLCCEDSSCSFCISSNNSNFWPRKRSNDDHGSAPETKRTRLDYRSHLLDGVQVKFDKYFRMQKFDIKEQVPRIDKNDIMKKFRYSFSLEYKALSDLDNSEL